MRNVAKTFALCLLSFTLQAADAQQEPELRDPTRISVNFRQALKNMTPAQQTANATQPTPVKMPKISLAAKVMTAGKTPNVLIRVDEQIIRIFQSGTGSVINGDSVIDIRVDEIDKHQVKIFVTPQNQTLILR